MEESTEAEVRDYEAEALSEGWVPKDEWKGAENTWVDAETFVRKGEEILPIVNAKNRKLADQVNELNRKVEELTAGNAKFKEFTDKLIERERKEKDKAIQELEGLKAKAISDGDGNAAIDAERKINDLRAKESKPNGEMTPEARAWVEANPLYTSDEIFSAMADGIAGRISDEIKQGRRAMLSQTQFYKLLDEKLKEALPQKYENPNRQTTKVENTAPGSSSTKGRTFEDLPNEAKAACLDFVKTIPNFTKEQYLKLYAWDE